MEKIYDKLAFVQATLKAPKEQFNKFGNYKYRKAEDILEAVKPLLQQANCTLTCTDELQLIGDRYYIKATATITSAEDGSHISTTAYAREEEEKKGMDGSQVTGASSSYARKYALNGLLCIDDAQDSDTTNVGEPAPKKEKTTKAAAAKVAATQQKVIITDKNIKELVDWTVAVPEGEQRQQRIASAKANYIWQGDLWNAYLTMVELS